MKFMNTITIKVADFTKDLDKIKEIREIVFQKGQGVDSSLDFDGEDESSEQLLAYLGEEAVGTARVRYIQGYFQGHCQDSRTKNNISNTANIAKIERLAVLPSARENGIGKKIMEKALLVIESNKESKNITKVVIHAQEYIKSLHQQVGFEVEGETFEEAGIAHVKMIKKLE